MARARAARSQKERARETLGSSSPASAARRAWWSPRSLVYVGLSSVTLAVPIAVIGSAAGPYDDPKAWALPILVAVTATVWLARPGLEPDGAAMEGPTRVFWWVVVAYLAWWLIATVASVAPWQSLQGNFGRGMGLLTVGAAGLLFFLVRSECRTPDAVRALIDSALLGSVPVCLLALGQALGWDPFPRSWDPATAAQRVRSTFGQHIFLGSYLAVLIPLGAARLDATFERWRSSEPSMKRAPGARRGLWPGAAWVAGTIGVVALASHWEAAWWALVPWGILGAIASAASSAAPGHAGRSAVSVALLASLVILQILVVVLSGARGPLLGVSFGLGVAGFTLLARRRAWKTLTASAGIAAALLVALALLNVPHSPLAPLAQRPALQRLSQLTNVERGTPVWFRLRAWSGIVSSWDRQLRGEGLVPGTSPWVRTALGYGPETQLLTLDALTLPSLGPLGVAGEGWRGSYVVDRVHNVLLDHLVTGGLIGAALWVALLASLLAVGVARVRSAGPGEETSLCLGCLGAILAHVAEGQVGIVTPMPLALFWIAAALLAGAPWSRSATSGRLSPGRLWRRAWWPAPILALAFLTTLIAWSNTRWLLASVAYANGTRHAMTGRATESFAEFRQSRDLVPWLPLPAEAFAQSALRLAGSQATAAGRLSILHEGEVALVESRRRALPSAASWTLSAQLTFAEAMAGEKSKLAASLDAFAAAVERRPGDPQLFAQYAWAWLESGNPERAGRTAERAIALSSDGASWLCWAVLARSARELGDAAKAERAAEHARGLAPLEARRMLESILR
jgi:hypothetical protein